MAVVRGLVGRKPGGVRWSWHGMALRVKKVKDGWWGRMCVVLQAVKHSGDVLGLASTELRNNPEIVLEVCTGKGIAWW